ncbi:MAG: hypothetical protein QN206_08800 [Armatimonadota bacterium]|nr:hypothetical protein [Armatimonadota bacterium]
MRFSVASREVFWRWVGRVQLADGPTLLLSGDVARWILSGEVVEVETEGTTDILKFEGFALRRKGVVLWPPWRDEVSHPRMSWSGKTLYAYRLVVREAMYERDFEAIAELEQFHYASEHEVVALWRCVLRTRAGREPQTLLPVWGRDTVGGDQRVHARKPVSGTGARGAPAV